MRSIYEDSIYFGLTLETNNGPARDVKTPAQVVIPEIFESYTHEPFKTIALWDTGATNSVISREFAQRMDLPPTGKMRTTGVHGTELVDTFTVNIILMNKVYFNEWEVSSGNILGDGVGILIGMDIISKGDFALTQRGKNNLRIR